MFWVPPPQRSLPLSDESIVMHMESNPESPPAFAPEPERRTYRPSVSVRLVPLPWPVRAATCDQPAAAWVSWFLIIDANDLEPDAWALSQNLLIPVTYMVAPMLS